MALAGHVSRKMLERYSHPRRVAKRAAVETLSRQGYDTLTTQFGKNDEGLGAQVIENMVDERGFEPPASSLRTRKNLR
jgi:hypothetical protein